MRKASRRNEKSHKHLIPKMPNFLRRSKRAYFISSTVSEFKSLVFPISNPFQNLENYGTSSHLFSLEGRILRLRQMIDREEFAEHTISVIATNNEAGPAGPVPVNSRARLIVHVKVNDVNDNPPKFKAESYSAGITSNDYPGKVLFYVFAEDPDEDDVISYTIEADSLETQGENLPTAPFPFALEQDSGRLTLAVQMTERMKGFFTFNVVATDLGECTNATSFVHTNNMVLFASPVDHTDKVQAKIFIIAESNRVKFVFLNKLDDIDTPEIRDFVSSHRVPPFPKTNESFLHPSSSKSLPITTACSAALTTWFRAVWIAERLAPVSANTWSPT